MDPLASNKGFWAEVLGVGDFYYELAVQIVEICLATRSVNGGLMALPVSAPVAANCEGGGCGGVCVKGYPSALHAILLGTWAWMARSLCNQHVCRYLRLFATGPPARGL